MRSANLTLTLSATNSYTSSTRQSPVSEYLDVVSAESAANGMAEADAADKWVLFGSHEGEEWDRFLSCGGGHNVAPSFPHSNISLGNSDQR